MAKAKEITGLDCGAKAVDWAAKVLNARFAEVCELRGQALDFSDIEGVHAMRVATRRLRGAIGDFAPLLQKRALRKARKDLKTIAHALGLVRDEDVAILALEKLRDAAPTTNIKTSIETFLSERRVRRDDAQIYLTETLSSNELILQPANFARFIKPKNRKKHLPDLSFNEAGRIAVNESLPDFYRLGQNLYAPFAADGLHELRIAAKQLRYAIELFTACWGKKIEPFAEQIARMQAILGEVHDCDIWIDNFGNRLAKNSDDDFQAAVWLLSKFTKKRISNYRAALKLWGKWKETNFIEEMRGVIGAIN